ncbi:MAG: hypothetical protein FJX59_07440 [Alphaproteobacteria bacterium]|nr:hypothetical protein [Alphaproteobacteria bacterium]
MRWIVIAAALAVTQAFAAPGDQLPMLKAESLAKKKFAWPTDFAAERNVLLISFGRDMQAEVDAWDAALVPLAKDGAVSVFNTPLIPNPGAIVRGFITGGMRGIYKDDAARARVVPLFVEEKVVFPQLGVGDRSSPLIIVYAKDGREIGRYQGKASEAGTADIARLVREP